MKDDLDTNHKLNRLHTAALWMVSAGALVALALTMQAGHKNKSVLLVLLFVIWVVSPFAALAKLILASKNWTMLGRRILFVLVPVITMGSLIVYLKVIHLQVSKPAFIFLITPLFSWICIAIAYFFFRAGKSKNPNDPPNK